MSKSKKAKQEISSPEKSKSKSYLLIHSIGAVCGFIAAIAVFISMIIYHIWVLIFPASFVFLIGLAEALSVRAVHKHGAKVIPPQIIFPTVRLWRNKGMEFRNNYPPTKNRKHH